MTAASRRLAPTALLFLVAFAWAGQALAGPEADDSPQGRGRGRRAAAPVYKTQLTPHWFDNNRRFWYRNDTRGGAKEFVLVDAEKGQRAPAFDHEKLAAALSKAAAAKYRADRLPFDSIEFVDGVKAVRFQVGSATWKCDLTSYECTPVERPAQPRSLSRSRLVTTGERRERDGEGEREREGDPESPWVDDLAPQAEQPPSRGRTDGGEARSPDRKWTAFLKEHNVWLRPADDGKEVQLSQDGKEGLAYGMLSWSPDSKALAAFRIEPGDRNEVYLIESSPPGGGRAKLRTRPYALPGDKFTAYELTLFDVAARKAIKPGVDRIDFGVPRLRWGRGRHFTYQKTDRGHQRFRLIEVDSHTGQARNLIDEQSKTFIWTAHTESVGVRPVTWLEKTDEIIYASERHGWRHLYLIDAKEGKIKNAITKGEWVVRGVERIDEDKRQVWFRASGKNAGQDPYFIHHYRVNFDGTGLVGLTEGDGTHTVQYSPDRKYLIDTYSRVDVPPAHELRRVADGKLMCKLEEADVNDLRATGWRPPEVFVAKGRDGKTDIWGVIRRPRYFDPNRKYPVIESIYAGPQGSFVPKAFSPFDRFGQLTELGFIVVQMDGMGTANRSKAFHDVCWHNLKDAGFPDRILWHKAVAQKYPSYDISRVGIYGTSAGGQSSTGALLFHPDFYKAAASACGCHDNRMDKASWNEQWMGYPVGPQYAECSNIDNAHRLRGKLLLIVGELDTNVPPESTLRLAGALIKAGKDFELLVVPGMGHSNGGPYGTRRTQDFFVRHLQGGAPPDRNAPAPAPAPAPPAPPANVPAADKTPLAKEQPKPPEVAVPDLRELVAKPASEVKLLAQRYAADRGNLGRFYNGPASPTRYARLRKCSSDWLGALEKLDTGRLSPEGRDDLKRLLEEVRRDLRQLDEQARADAEVAPLLPFAGTIIGLEEARRRMERVDAARAAGLVNELKKQIEATRKAVEVGANGGGRALGVRLDKEHARRAAEKATALRGALKNWYSFSNDYDPLFTWWLAAPYKDADKALEGYAAFLRESGTAEKAPSAGEEKAPASPAPLPAAVSLPQGSDVPDLQQLLSFPRSGMAGVIERYQADRRKLSPVAGIRGRGAGVPRSPEGLARMKKFTADWLAALEKLDFDALGQDGQIDYLLLKNHLESQQRRLALPAPAGRGRPAGREALLADLAAEMVPYTPEELIAIAEREFAWCEAEMKWAARDMGLGDDWRKAVEKVKTLHVEPGRQPELIRDLAREAVDYVRRHDLVTVPPLAAETWRMEMMSPQRQLVNPFFTGGEVISVSYPTSTMAHEAKLQSMRGNNVHFSRATVHHELIPGHHLQMFMNARYRSHRGPFATPFWLEGWALYWEMRLYGQTFARSPEDRVGLLFWRMHRCARIVFSLRFHLGQWSQEECVDYLVKRVGHERDNAAAEARRSFAGGYAPLYQAAYMLGGLQFRALHRELVGAGKMSERAFHDAVLTENRIPVALVRASLTKQKLTRDWRPDWRWGAP
jgi:dipeptidyl aminopeptidase/acylaminoacyl peptidase